MEEEPASPVQPVFDLFHEVGAGVVVMMLVLGLALLVWLTFWLNSLQRKENGTGDRSRSRD